MTVTVVLVLIELIGFGFVVAAVGAGDHRLGIEHEADVALEMNGGGRIDTRWKDDIAATGAMTLFDGLVDRRGVVGLAVASRAELANVEFGILEDGSGDLGWSEGVGGVGAMRWGMRESGNQEDERDGSNHDG